MTEKKAEKRASRTRFLVGLSVFAVLYFLIVPIFLSWYVQKRLLGKPMPTVDAVLEIVVRPATWTAARVRPYYEYWRQVAIQVSDVPVLTWDEMQHRRAEHKKLP